MLASNYQALVVYDSSLHISDLQMIFFTRSLYIEQLEKESKIRRVKNIIVFSGCVNSSKKHLPTHLNQEHPGCHP